MVRLARAESRARRIARAPIAQHTRSHARISPQGQGASAEEADATGYRVLGVQPNSPASDVGLVSFFDFVVAVDGVELRELDSTFIDKIKAAWPRRLRSFAPRDAPTRVRPAAVRGQAAALRRLQPQEPPDAERDHHADAQLGRPGHAGRDDPLRHVPQGRRAPRPRARGRAGLAGGDRGAPGGHGLPPRHGGARLRRLGRASRRVLSSRRPRDARRLPRRSSTTSARCTSTNPSSSTSTTRRPTRSASSSSSRRTPGAAAAASAPRSRTATSTASPRGVESRTASPSSPSGPSRPTPATPWPSTRRRRRRRPTRRSGPRAPRSSPSCRASRRWE